VLAQVDPETGGPLVDVILDEAQQKGTGKWMSQDAFDVGAPIPTVNAAVVARPLARLRCEQGSEMGRPSIIEVEVDTSSEPVSIRVGGRVARSVEGSIFY